MFHRPLEWVCCLVILQIGATVVLGQHDGVPVRRAPVRSAPVYDGADSVATSRVSNGRITAHLEYEDRDSTGRRGDITRTGSDSTGRSQRYGSSTSDVRTQTGATRPVSGGVSTTRDRTQSGRRPYETPEPGRRIPTYAGTPDQDSGATTYDSTSTSETERRVPVYDPTSTTDTSRRTYSSTRDRPRLATRQRFGTSSQIPFDRATQTGGGQYNPVLTGRTSYVSQPVDRRTQDRGIQRGSFYQQCPTDNFRILIDNVECHLAVTSLGSHICYDDRVMRDRRCCERCLQIRNYQKPGCEYGDRTRQCSAINPSQCYFRTNRNICCQTCERLRDQTKPGCEYGDLAATCAQLPRGMCANAENQRICCQTCERMRDPFRPECPFGDRSSQCGVISGGACYNPRVKDACCATCQRLDVGIPGCQYGDHNAVWSSTVGDLDCETYVRIYGQGSCADANFATRCCRSCRSWSQGSS